MYSHRTSSLSSYNGTRTVTSKAFCPQGHSHSSSSAPARKRAVADGMLVAAGDASPDGCPVSIIENQAKAAAAACANCIREVLSRVAISLAVTEQLGQDLGLVVALPMLAALEESHRHVAV